MVQKQTAYYEIGARSPQRRRKSVRHNTRPAAMAKISLVDVERNHVRPWKCRGQPCRSAATTRSQVEHGEGVLRSKPLPHQAAENSIPSEPFIDEPQIRQIASRFRARSISQRLGLNDSR